MTSDPSRPRDAKATRDALLRAARCRLAAHGYDDVSLREIAADVGVNVAMVHRYFGTKDDLFLEVLDSEPAGLRFLEGDPATFGDRMATAVILETVDLADLDNLMILVRSVGSERGRALSQGARITRFQQPLIDWLEGAEAAERAFLIASLVIGAAITREIVGNGPEVVADQAVIRDRLAALLQCLAAPDPADDGRSNAQDAMASAAPQIDGDSGGRMPAVAVECAGLSEGAGPPRPDLTPERRQSK